MASTLRRDVALALRVPTAPASLAQLHGHLYGRPVLASVNPVNPG